MGKKQAVLTLSKGVIILNPYFDTRWHLHLPKGITHGLKFHVSPGNMPP